MLRLSLRPLEVWSEEREEFLTIFKGGDVELEHSLYTVALWEAKHKKAFADRDGLTREELFDYIKECMCVTDGVPQEAWLSLTNGDIKKISEYLQDDACATKIYRHSDSRKPGKEETMTAELAYFYMAQFNIPFECEHWHFNRLMKLIDVAAIKSSPPQKMGKKASARYQHSLNMQRRAGRM